MSLDNWPFRNVFASGPSMASMASGARSQTTAASRAAASDAESFWTAEALAAGMKSLNGGGGSQTVGSASGARREAEGT